MFCYAVIDYDALRVEFKHVFVEKIDEVRFALSRLQKAQRVAEQTLDMCDHLLEQCLVFLPDVDVQVRKSMR